MMLKIACTCGHPGSPPRRASRVICDAEYLSGLARPLRHLSSPLQSKRKRDRKPVEDNAPPFRSPPLQKAGDRFQTFPAPRRISMSPTHPC
jgi:hypothetical protein